MEWVLELDVLVCEFQFLEEHEDHAIEEGAWVILGAAANDRPQQVQVVPEEHPFEDEHLVDVR